MSSAKITTMVLNTVDLQCFSCYKKVKKVLCKFPGIRDQVYDEKNSKVTIKVLCCDPEKIRDMLCCEGRKVIKSIEIVDDAPKYPVEEEPEPVVEPEPVPSDKPPVEEPEPVPSDKPPVEEEPEPVPVCEPVPGGACCGTCAQGYGGGPCYQGHGRPVPPPPGPCYQGYGRPVPPPPSPCYQGYGRPVSPPPGPCYDYKRPVPCYDYERPVPPPPSPCYDYEYGYRGSKCCVSTDCLSEENPQGCTIM